MSVSMMQVRPVRVAVRQPVVAVPVAVPGPGGKVRVLVEVMPVVVPMGMDVLDGLVNVQVLVPA